MIEIHILDDQDLVSHSERLVVFLNPTGNNLALTSNLE
jgi:hypothetical protein